jgi:hypothetical protein
VLLLLCVTRKEEEEEGDGIAFFFFFVPWSLLQQAPSSGELQSFRAPELAFLSCSKLQASESSGACRAPDRFGACYNKLRARSKQVPSSELATTSFELQSLLQRKLRTTSLQQANSELWSLLFGCLKF